MQDKFMSFCASENGQGVTEYSLVLSLIAVGVITILVSFHQKIETIFQNGVGKINNAIKDNGLIN
ncbi:Flp family type IVb pilin [Paenibacillus sp. GCM10027628]|uniref:Flp family type IVb pilin n=1 Tax=Paenibacillus sp. GCM10027628 TaxID=3273413 RepID=UPI00362762B4